MSFIAQSRRRCRPDARRGVSALVVALALAACASPTADTIGPNNTITVFASSSLTEPFTAIAKALEADHPAMKVNLSFGASSSLVSQIAQGAPADVIALADEPTMQRAQSLGVVTDPPTTFAENSLAIITTRGNPHRVATLSDLSRSDLVVVIGSPETPIGAYTAQVLARAGTIVNPASLEPNVKAVVAKIVSGEADAGVVYVSDVIAAGSRVSAVTIPAAQNTTARYSIAIVASTRRRPAAEAFIAAVSSPSGRNALVEAGFTTP